MSIEISGKKRSLVITELSRKYGLRCWYCGRELGKNESICIDHIKPISKNGQDEIENYALSCVLCNRAKLDLDIEIFLEWLAHIRSGEFLCPVLCEVSKKNLGDNISDRLQKSFY